MMTIITGYKEIYLQVATSPSLTSCAVGAEINQPPLFQVLSIEGQLVQEAQSFKYLDGERRHLVLLPAHPLYV